MEGGREGRTEGGRKKEVGKGRGGEPIHSTFINWCITMAFINTGKHYCITTQHLLKECT